MSNGGRPTKPECLVQWVHRRNRAWSQDRANLIEGSSPHHIGHTHLTYHLRLLVLPKHASRETLGREKVTTQLTNHKLLLRQDLLVEALKGSPGGNPWSKSIMTHRKVRIRVMNTVLLTLVPSESSSSRQAGSGSMSHSWLPSTDVRSGYLFDYGVRQWFIPR